MGKPFRASGFNPCTFFRDVVADTVWVGVYVCVSECGWVHGWVGGCVCVSECGWVHGWVGGLVWSTTAAIYRETVQCQITNQSNSH